MLTAQQAAEFHRHGFLNGGGVLGDEEVEELAAELDRVLERGADGFSAAEPRPVLLRDLNAARPQSGPQPVWQVVNIWEASPAFERLLYHPAIVKAVSQLTAEPDLLIWHDQIQYKPAACGGATRWHQDAPLWPSIRPMTPGVGVDSLRRRRRRERLHVDGARQSQMGQPDRVSPHSGASSGARRDG